MWPVDLDWTTFVEAAVKQNVKVELFASLTKDEFKEITDAAGMEAARSRINAKTGRPVFARLRKRAGPCLPSSENGQARFCQGMRTGRPDYALLRKRARIDAKSGSVRNRAWALGAVGVLHRMRVGA